MIEQFSDTQVHCGFALRLHQVLATWLVCLLAVQTAAAVCTC